MLNVIVILSLTPAPLYDNPGIQMTRASAISTCIPPLWKSKRETQIKHQMSYPSHDGYDSSRCKAAHRKAG